MKKLNLYNIDLKYIRDLSSIDDNIMSISLQRGKQNRPFVGVLNMNNMIPVNEELSVKLTLKSMERSGNLSCKRNNGHSFSDSYHGGASGRGIRSIQGING